MWFSQGLGGGMRVGSRVSGGVMLVFLFGLFIFWYIAAYIFLSFVLLASACATIYYGAMILVNMINGGGIFGKQKKEVLSDLLLDEDTGNKKRILYVTTKRDGWAMPMLACLFFSIVCAGSYGVWRHMSELNSEWSQGMALDAKKNAQILVDVRLAHDRMGERMRYDSANGINRDRDPVFQKYLEDEGRIRRGEVTFEQVVKEPVEGVGNIGGEDEGGSSKAEEVLRDTMAKAELSHKMGGKFSNRIETMPTAMEAMGIFPKVAPVAVEPVAEGVGVVSGKTREPLVKQKLAPVYVAPAPVLHDYGRYYAQVKGGRKRAKEPAPVIDGDVGFHKGR